MKLKYFIKSSLNNIYHILYNHSIGDGSIWLAIIASAYISSSVASLIRFKSYGLREFIKDFSYPLFFSVSAAVFLLLFLLTVLTKTKKHAYRFLCLSAVIFASALGTILDSKIYFNVGLAIIIIIIGKAAVKDNRICFNHKLSYRSGYIITFICVILFSALGAYLTYFKYRTFSEATFDLGIFTQMFENMAETGIPITSVERGKELTHFAVHFSPFFYILLPGYLLFRSPLYLFVVQSAGVCIGAFPIYRIGKKLEFSPTASLLFSLIYLCYPTMLNGCFRDFHENKFLAVCILYLMLFVLEHKNIGTVIFTLLTLSIKEDAALYVCAVALFIIITQKKRLRGWIMLAFAVMYYAFAVHMISYFGGTAMVSRFANYYLDGNSGILSVIKTCIFDIGYLILKVFTSEKIVFILWTGIPLMFGFLNGNSVGTAVLLIPALVINLMSDWIYQYNVDFQYTYGSCSLMIVATMIAWSKSTAAESEESYNIYDHNKPFISLMLCVVFTLSLMFGKVERYVSQYLYNRESYVASTEILKEIPSEASVTAGDYLVPHLYYVRNMQSYPAIYGKLEKTDYMVVDIRMLDNGFDPYDFMDGEYEMLERRGFVEVWKKTIN